MTGGQSVTGGCEKKEGQGAVTGDQSVTGGCDRGTECDRGL